MFRPARLPFSPISPPVAGCLSLFENDIGEIAICVTMPSSLHRRLYSGRIILVTKSITTAAIKIHTGRPFGMILGLVIISGAVHGDKVALHFWSGKDCWPGSQDKGRHGLPSCSRTIPFIHRAKKRMKTESYSQNGRPSQEILNKSSPRAALSLISP